MKKLIVLVCKFVVYFDVLLLMSCKDDIQSIASTDIVSIKMNANAFENGDIYQTTRTTLLPVEDGTKFQWQVGDVAAVYSSGRGMTNFFIDENSISQDGTSAVFNGSGFSLFPNTLYYGFYPYLPQSTDKTQVSIHYNGQNMLKNGDFQSLGKFDYMWSRGVTDDNGDVSFNFSHIGSVIEMNLEAPVSANYCQVRIEVESNKDSASVIKSGIVNLTSDYPKIICSNTTKADTIFRINLNNAEGIFVEKDSILKVYMMMAPQDLSSKNIIIRLVDDNNNWFTASTVGKNMKEGKTYHYYVGKNSSQGGFSGKGVGLPDDYVYKKMGTFVHPTIKGYEDLLVHAGDIYAVGYFGLRKINFSNENAPELISDNESIVDNYSRARSIKMNNDYLYVNVRQNTWGANEIFKPQIRYSFENKFNEFTEERLTNNSLLNNFFKEFNTNRDISRIYSIVIFKAYERSDGFRNAIVLRLNGENDIVLLGKTYSTKQEAIEALCNEYKNTNGDYCKVDWDVIEDSYNDISNVVFYYTKGAKLSKSTKTSFDNFSCPSPNQGLYCGKFSTGDISSTSQVTLRYSVNAIDTGWFSFWINVPHEFSNMIKCPLTYNGDICYDRINLMPQNNGYSISLKDVSISTDKFRYGEWYNIKVHISNNGSELYFRNSECGNWTLIDSNDKPSRMFNGISIGLSTIEKNFDLYIDDFYFNETDIDKVSYVNGKVYILDKANLSIKNRLNLDYRATGLAIANNILIVSGLYNIKFYDVSNPILPTLIYTYQPSYERDMQGITTYTVNGKVYAFVCCYSTGYMIWDITNKEDIRLVCDEDFSDVLYKGLSVKGKINTFNSLVDYPFAYLTVSPTPSYVSSFKNVAGILRLNLLNLSNIEKQLYLLPDTTVSSNIKGDPTPTTIAKYGNTIFINNRDYGISVFDVVNNVPIYRDNIKIGNSIYPIVISPDGRMFVADDANSDGDKNLYLFRIE